MKQRTRSFLRCLLAKGRKEKTEAAEGPQIASILRSYAHLLLYDFRELDRSGGKGRGSPRRHTRRAAAVDEGETNGVAAFTAKGKAKDVDLRGRRVGEARRQFHSFARRCCCFSRNGGEGGKELFGSPPPLLTTAFPRPAVHMPTTCTPKEKKTDREKERERKRQRELYVEKR